MQAIRQFALTFMLLTSLAFSSFGGNSCSNPVLLQCGSYYYGTNNTGNYFYTNYPFPYGYGMTGPEAYHRLTIVFPALVTITMTGLTADLDMYLLSTCGNTNGLAYSYNSNTSSEQISINLNPGTYYLIADGYNGAISNYNLNVQCTQNTSCEAPLYGDLYTSDPSSCTSVRLNCQTAGPNTWAWAYRQLNTANWNTLPNTSNPFIDLTGLQASTTYEYKCSIRCSNMNWSEWSPIRQFTTPNCGPTGNNCSNPIPAYCGYNYTGNNGSGGYNFTTYKYNGQTLTTEETGPEKVYQLNLSTAGPISISLGGLSGDLDLFLLKNCNNYSVVAYSGNSGSLGEVISIGNLAAGTYQIVIDGWRSTISNYSMSVTCNGIVPISNDEPCYPTVLTSYTYCYTTNATNVGATTTLNPLPPSECNTSDMRDVWFKVGIPASGKIKVSTFPGTLTNGLLGIYAGPTCTGLTNYGCIDNSPGSLMPEATISAPPGSYVYLRFWGYNGTIGSFSICVTTLYGLNDGDADVTIGDDGAGNREVEDNPYFYKGEDTRMEDELISFRLFPVPALDEINLSVILAEESNLTVRILCMTGQLVKEEILSNIPVGEYETTVNVSQLPSGTYILRLQSDNKEITKKFVKL